MKNRNSTILLFIIFLTGLSLLLYPTASDWWNSFHQSRAIASYAQQVAELDNTAYRQAWADAQSYNAQLPQDSARFHPTEEDTARYQSLLNITGSGIMGYIEIPSDSSIAAHLPWRRKILCCRLPSAILNGSSLPVGGADSHCDGLSGHRGLPICQSCSTNLDQLADRRLYFCCGYWTKC